MKYIHLAFLLAFTLSVQTVAPQTAASSQQTPQSTPQTGTKDDDEVVRITTNVVQLDFVVTDKEGNQVTDLKADDIQVFEDGHEQKISNFSYISTEPTSSATAENAIAHTPADKSALPPAVPARRENVRRTIAVVVDDLGMSFQTVVPARSALRKFVEQQVRPGDLVAIIRTGGEVGALQQFTTDKRQLLAAIERLRWNPCSRRGISNTAPLRQDSLTTGNLLSGSRGGNTGTGTDLPACSNYTLDATLESLRFIIGGMRELPGRKTVVIFSDSIPIDAPEIGGVVPPLNANNTNQTTFPSISRSDRRSYRDPLRNISELAIRSSVVIYAVDTRGLPGLGISAADDTAGVSAQQVSQVLNTRSDDMISGREGSESLAHQTGGFVIKNNNDISLGLRRIMNDLRGYYLVGYRPTSETFNRRYHKIAARLRNHPELVVRSRTGFYGVREEESRPKSPTAADRFNLALTSPFSAGDIDVQLTPIFTNEEASGSFLRTMLHIDAHGLALKPEADGWQIADIILRGVLFGDNGKIVDEHRASFTVRLRGATLKRVQARGLDYVFNMPVKKPGAYQFRVAVLDPTSGHIGSAGQFVEVPDIKKDRIALSSLVLRGIVPTASNAGGAPAQLVTQGTSGASEPQDSEATPALRRFHQQMLLDYNYIVFNAHTDKQNPQPQLTARTQLFHDGQPVFDRETPVQIAQQIDPTRAVAVGRLKLGNDLPPGDYVLQITVTDPLADRDHQRATQWIDFEIVK